MGNLFVWDLTRRSGVRRHGLERLQHGFRFDVEFFASLQSIDAQTMGYSIAVANDISRMLLAVAIGAGILSLIEPPYARRRVHVEADPFAEAATPAPVAQRPVMPQNPATPQQIRPQPQRPPQPPRPPQA
ncbi:MAG: hypothetical protein QM775_15580 [Pirellulales bacterium]